MDADTSVMTSCTLCTPNTNLQLVDYNITVQKHMYSICCICVSTLRHMVLTCRRATATAHQYECPYPPSITCRFAHVQLSAAAHVQRRPSHTWVLRRAHSTFAPPIIRLYQRRERHGHRTERRMIETRSPDTTGRRVHLLNCIQHPLFTSPNVISPCSGAPLC